MQNLQIVNANFIIYKDEHLTVDVLGGVNLQQIERLVCTLRITSKSYPPHRSTLDLYNDNQFDKLLRTLCEKFELKLLDVSKSLHALILQLEEYRLQNLKYTDKSRSRKFEMTETEKQTAVKRLKNKNLLQLLSKDLQTIGIIGEDDKAVILFLSLASCKYTKPFSVLCLAKNGTGKSYLLQKLSECMPNGSYSFHTQITENALYYFRSEDLQNKALLIEDLEFTSQMLNPLSTLQSHGKLIKTRTTKDKDGMLHSTTFEVIANLCLVACAYSDKNYEELSLPFLCLHLNQSHAQDMEIMEYQKQCKAGLIQQDEINKIQRSLKCLIASLESVSIINPYATLINLPQDVGHPRKTLLLLLNFIDVITYFFQHQRERTVNKNTGEIFIKTHPEDIETAFKYLKPHLFRRADELSTTTRNFYNWLTDYLQQAKTNKFTALDIRKACIEPCRNTKQTCAEQCRSIHPRTLNRYLQELKLFSYIEVAGGNKYREGFIYKLTNFGDQTDIKSRIENDINNTIQAVWNAYGNTTTDTDAKTQTLQQEQILTSELQNTNEFTEETPNNQQETKPDFLGRNNKRIRINEKEEYTMKILLELEAEEQGRQYTASNLTAITKRSQCIEARYLKALWEQGKLNRELKDRQYYYTLATTNSNTLSLPKSKTVGQTEPAGY